MLLGAFRYWDSLLPTCGLRPLTPTTGDQLIIAAVYGTLVVISWFWPLIIYVGNESEAVHLDEGFLVALLLLVPYGCDIATFALATIIAQA